MSLRPKTSFPEKVYPRKPLFSCSRIGVQEGSPKKNDFEKEKNLKKHLPKHLKNTCRKSDVKIIEKHSKIIQKWGQHPLKNNPKINPTINQPENKYKNLHKH